MAIMTVRQYARHRGVHHSSVQQAVMEGKCPARADGKIDSEKADASWPQELSGKGKSKSSSPSLLESREIKEAYNARLAKLDFDERMGNLVHADEVRRDGYEAGTKIKNALSSLPDRLAAEFAGELNQFAIHKRLKEEIDVALKSLLEKYPDPNGNT